MIETLDVRKPQEQALLRLQFAEGAVEVVADLEMHDVIAQLGCLAIARVFTGVFANDR